MMLDSIRLFFENNFSQVNADDDVSARLRLATAALLIEMMQQDGESHDAEHQAITTALREKFNLSEEETHQLVELAHDEARTATDYYQFTRLIAQEFSQQQKVKVIEYLWMIAYADEQLNSYEEHMVRRIADLIYVSHADFIQAKHRVQKSLGLAD